MPSKEPPAITPAEHQLRLRRVRRIARNFGFRGRIEYRHLLSESGGAQFGLASDPEQDLLTVDAEAFLRDANPDDFSLEAIIAHERGHQIVCRNEQLQAFLGGKIALATEEVLASLAGSWLVAGDQDRQSLVLKALDETLQCGLTVQEATGLIKELRALMEHVR
ncbi:MAG TPA: hypothetical protein VFW87_04535 [Pirellulales bacterium]|nr:hypothetical protein [Pirellulales bacterium]